MSVSRRPARTRNQLLASLPPEEYQRLQPMLKDVHMPSRHAIHRRGERLENVYFPGAGVTSMSSSMRGGGAIEVAAIGPEGLVGLPAFFGRQSAICDATVVVADPAAKAMAVEHFRAEIARRGPLFDLVSFYADAFLGLVLQTSACNSLHSVEERCARWLLLTRDRLESDEFGLTHDAIAVVLGVRRPTISIVIDGLERQGLVRHHRGRIAIVNRRGLERVACECYRAIRRHFNIDR